MTFKHFTTLLLLPFAVYASTIEYYQINGIKKLETALDDKLASTEYWSDTLGDKNLSYGLFNSYSTLIICEKNRSKLSRVTLDHNHTLKPQESYSAFLGKVNGDKEVEGDLKTPIGVYKLTQQLDHVDPFYGPLALVTNYPNSYDQAKSKTGSGIWIHGLPLQGNRDTFTKGCMAIDNESLQTLAHNISTSSTALIISPSDHLVTNKQEIVTLLSSLFKWRNAWKRSDFTTYASFYDENFKNSSGKNRKTFLEYKASLFSYPSKKQISLYDINIIPYPTSTGEKLFFITMQENYKTKHVHFKGTKELYVKLNDTHMTIVMEN